MLKNLAWDEFNALETADKLPYLGRTDNGQRFFHVLFAQQFDRDTLDYLCELADKIR